MVGVDSKSEIEILQAPSEVKSVSDRFAELFRKELKEQKRIYGPEYFTFPRFRAIESTINSEEFNEKDLTNEEIREFADFLLGSRRHSKDFKELVGNYANPKNIDFSSLPRNARRIYAAGKAKLRD